MTFSIYYKGLKVAIALAGLSLIGCELNKEPDPVIPELTTNAVSSISSTEATSGGIISSDGGDPVTDRGVVWSTTESPTVSSGTKISSGAGSGSFTTQITGLNPNTTYFVRAFGFNPVI